nr:M3 family metallopeptidase [Elusimicrobiota bacterium]
MNKNLNWNLDHILPAGEFESFLKKLKKDLPELKKFAGKLEPGMETAYFSKFIKYTEDVKRRVSILSYLGHLMEAVDQKSQKARKLKAMARDMEVYAAKKLRKTEHWMKGKKVEGLKRLDDKNAARLFKSVPDLSYVLKYKRELAGHTLSEKEEDIIAHIDAAGSEAVTELRALIETEFEYFFKPEGTKRGKTIKTQAGLTSYVKSASAAEREEAYSKLLEKYRDNIDKFFIIYEAVVKDWVYEADLRNFKSPISVRNKYNHISDRAIDILIKVCEANRGVFHKYFKYKAGELGKRKNKLSRFDLYAPVAKKSAPEIGPEEAKNIVLETIGDFSADFRQKAEKIIKDRHIDYMPSPVKTGGAFCATVEPGITPYIMLNHSGKYRDILTLAHELGHGIHSLYADRHSVSSQQASLPLAETASTFAETLVFEKLYR